MPAQKITKSDIASYMSPSS